MTYKDVIEEYGRAAYRICLSDEYLEKIDSPSRQDLPIVGDYYYGVAYMRDDAIELLIGRIHELDEENKKLREEIVGRDDSIMYLEELIMVLIQLCALW